MKKELSKKLRGFGKNNMSDYFTPEGYLSSQKVRDVLKSIEYEGEKLTEEKVGDIVEQFWFQDYYSNFIAIPDVFNSLQIYLNEHGPKVKRVDFYRYYFSKVVTDDARWSSLELISVDFETKQRNDINQGLLQEVLDKNKITNVSFEWLIEKNFIWQIENKFEWRHHTYTEFFTSEYILKQKNPIKAVDKLAVLYVEADKSKNIKPSWHGVIKFLLQSEKSHDILSWLIKLIRENPLNLNEDLTNIISMFSPTDLKASKKEELFNIIYDSYQERMIWLPVWARSGLAKFFTSNQLNKLEKHLEKTDDEVETYVHRGNVVAVVGELIELGTISNKKQINVWKDRFVKYALDDNDNGVLQRHSLHALRQFKEEDGQLILKLRKNLASSDTLVRDAFIQYCSESAPNTKESIDVFADAYSEGMSRVYSRHGMYEISTLEGFSYLIDKLTGDGTFLHEFIDSESIFDGDRKDPDAEFVQKILALARSNDSLAEKLSELLKAVIKNDEIYQIERSYFVRNISSFIFEDHSRGISFIREVTGEKKITHHFIHNFFDILPEVLTSLNWEEIFKILEATDIECVDRHLERVSYGLRFRKENDGKKLFEEIAKKKGYKIEKQKDYKKEEKKRQDELYKEFKFKIEPDKGRFMGDVFEYYLNNSELIEERWSDYEKERMLFLAYEDGIKRLNPRDFKVSFEEKKKRGGRFKWSSQAAFYGEMIKVVQRIRPDLLEEQGTRQHIIDFTPYCYSDDYKVVHELITTIEPSEISWLVDLYKNENDDRRYLVPESFVYFLESLLENEQDISTAIPTLRTFILDENISDWVNRSALELLGKIEDSSKEYLKFLENVFGKSTHDNVKEEANSQLIILYEDENAIKWRFEQVKARIAPFKRTDGFHSVGELESELDSRSFIAPLIDSKSKKILTYFFDLLDSVLPKLKDNYSFFEYFNYVWTSYLEYISKFSEKDFFDNFDQLVTWSESSNLPTKILPFLEHTLNSKRSQYISKLVGEEQR